MQIEQIQAALNRATATQDEYDADICTRSAERIARWLGTGRVLGYFSEDNPTAILGQPEGGHDFLVLDEFIVDWWAQEFYGQPAILHRVEDADQIKFLYGDPAAWETP